MSEIRQACCQRRLLLWLDHSRLTSSILGLASDLVHVLTLSTTVTNTTLILLMVRLLLILSMRLRFLVYAVLAVSSGNDSTYGISLWHSDSGAVMLKEKRRKNNVIGKKEKGKRR